MLSIRFIKPSSDYTNIIVVQYLCTLLPGIRQILVALLLLHQRGAAEQGSIKVLQTIRHRTKYIVPYLGVTDPFTISFTLTASARPKISSRLTRPSAG